MASSVDAKLLKSTKFPVEFNQKVDMQKVNVEVLKKWIASKILEILGEDDDVVIELCFNLIEGFRFPDIKKMQIQLTGFLDKDTPAFCKDLWKLCLSAQSNAQGVPKELLEAKKLELIQEKLEAEKSAEDTRRRREVEQRRDTEIRDIRTRERGEHGRGGGKGGDSWRGGRGDDRDREFGGRGDDRNRAWDGRGEDRDRNSVGRGFDRGVPRYSRSPRRRDSRERGAFREPPPREADTYVPGIRGGRRRPERRRSSASKSISPARDRSESKSRSPPRRRAHSPSRSRSPAPRRRRSRSPDRWGRGRGGRGRGRSPDRGTRRRSNTSSRSRSRSSRPAKRRRSTASVSLNPSPPPKSRRSRHESTSRSRTRSLTRSLSRTPRRSSSSPPLVGDVTETRADGRRNGRDERRLTRSNSRSRTPPRRRRRSPSRNSSREGGNRKRRRSMQRYEPASKRRRNTSSVTSPIETRNAKADEDENDRRSPRREIEASKAESNEIKDPQKQASELREKLLREKIKKMRTSSIESLDAQANSH